jgi:hypothetical protein
MVNGLTTCSSLVAWFLDVVVRQEQTGKTRLPAPHSSRLKAMSKTYDSRDSPVVTHLTTGLPVRCLNRAERTGSLVFNVLWSYVEGLRINLHCEKNTQHTVSTNKHNIIVPLAQL